MTANINPPSIVGRRRRRNLHAFRAIAHACLMLVMGGAVASDAICPPLESPAPAMPSWDQDTAYELNVKKLPSGKLSLTVVGDVVVIDEAQFATIVRAVDRASSNVGELVIDAREVRIAAPLSFDSALVRILAHTVVFERRGAIALTSRPSGASDGLEVSALRIDLTQASRVPIQVAVEAGSGGRRVAVRAEELLLSARQRPGVSDSLQLWRRSSNYVGQPAAPLPGAWQVMVGARGEQAAVAELRSAATWPEFFAYKLHKHHAAAPFRAVELGLDNRMEAMRPLLERLQRTDALQSLNAVGTLMAQRVDRRGRKQSWVPSEDLLSGLDRYEKLLNNAEPHLRRLAAQIVAAHEEPRVDKAAVAAVDSRLAALSADMLATSRNIDEVFTVQASLHQELAQVAELISHEQGRSKSKYDERKRRDRETGEIIAATTAGLAVVTMFAGAPPEVGAAIGAAGGIAKARHEGKPVDVTLLIDLAAQAKALYSRIEKTRKSWERHSADVKTARSVFDGQEVRQGQSKAPLTRFEASKRAALSAVDFGKGVKDIVDSLAAQPKPERVSLNQFEAANAELQRAIVRQTELMVLIESGAERLAQLNQAWSRETSALGEMRSVKESLLEIKPSNTQELTRWKVAAQKLFDLELQSLHDQASDLQRSLYFETLRTVPMPTAVAGFSEQAAAVLGRSGARLEDLARSGIAENSRQRLEQDIQRHLVALRAVWRGVSDAWAAHRNQVEGTPPYLDSRTFADRQGEPDAERRLIQQLNLQLQQAFMARTPQEQVIRLSVPPFPMDVRPPRQGLPERIIAAGVRDVKFRRGAGLAQHVYFDVGYTLAGTLRHGGRCDFVDFSLPGQPPASVVWRQQAVASLQDGPQGHVPKALRDRSESRTVGPARTDYFISVDFAGRGGVVPAAVPQIESLTFWKEKVQ